MRKRKSKELWTLLLAILLIVGCSPKSEPEIPVEEIKLSQRTLTMVIGESASIRASISPANASAQNLFWQSENNDVASVADGEIRALKAGETFITVKTGEKTATCLIKVVQKQVPTESVALPATIEMKVGDVKMADLTLTPADASDDVVWSSDNEEVVSVMGGELTAHKVGTAKITVKSGKHSATTTVTVSQQDVTIQAFALKETKITVPAGEAYLIETEIKADRPNDVEVSWTSNNKEVAQVTHGRINALKPGKAIITASAGKFTAECEVEVVDKNIVVESIAITPETLELRTGQNFLAVAKTQPVNLFEPITWSSEDEKVAKVNQYGYIVSVAPGETNIKATIGGKTGICKVKVVEKSSADIFEIEITDITATEAKISIKPKNKEMTYYCYAMSKHKYDKTLADPSIKEISDFDIAFWKEQGKDRWLEALKMDLIKGDFSGTLDGFVRFPIWDTEYVVYCYGIDENGIKTSETLIKTIKTKPSEPINMTFQVDIRNVTSQDFEATITPSHESETYYISLQQTKFIDAYVDALKNGETRDQHNGWDPVDHMIWKMILSDISFDSFQLRKGKLEIDKNFFAKKNFKFRKYELMVIGIDRKKGKTTELFRFPIEYKP